MSRRNGRFLDLSPEGRKAAADLLRALRRRGRRRGEGMTPPLSADDPQHKIDTSWEIPDEHTRVDAIIDNSLDERGGKETLSELKKLAASYPSTPSDPVQRAIREIEQKARRKGALVTAENKRTRAGYAPPEVVAEVAAKVDRLAPQQSSVRRYRAMRGELRRRRQNYPRDDFARWVKASLKNFNSTR